MKRPNPSTSESPTPTPGPGDPLETATDDLRWAAVETRDASAVGAFIYAVTTTGVYCRPDCPARRPRRRNVRYFLDADAATRAGFRACLRCRPGDTDQISSLDPSLQRAVAYLADHYDGTSTLDDLAAATDRSASHLQRTFRREFGLTPRQATMAMRFARLRHEVHSDRGTPHRGDNVTTAQLSAGFGSSRGLYESAASYLGMTPREYGRRGRGRSIRAAIRASRFGQALIACTERGVCSVLLGDNPDELRRALREEFSEAELSFGEPTDATQRSWIDAVVQHVDDTPHALTVPLAVEGTPFEVSVWRALCDIPVGETRTYGEVAAAIGRPSATRAVASACGRNVVAVLIPCHRVVPKQARRKEAQPELQQVGGYRWGPERKRALLEAERSTRGAAKRAPE